ncbi:MAG TPA: amidohydrolase [Planctomycetes bacterium]|nr:amidohydrolase [Planctomycetota bacterium]
MNGNFVVHGATVFIPSGWKASVSVRVKNGRIAEIGKIAPKRAEAVVDAHGCFLTPGLIDAHTHAGIGGEGEAQPSKDVNETTDPFTPHLRSLDAINPDDLSFRDARANGVTTIAVFPGSANVFGGSGCAVNTVGRSVEEMLVSENVGLKAAFGENPKGVYGPNRQTPATRLGIGGVFREKLYRAKQVLGKKKPPEDIRFAALEPLLKRRVPLRAHAHRANDILTAVRVAEEFELKLVIEHATEGHKIADILAEKRIPCCVGPLLWARSKEELRNRSVTTPAVLAGAGVLVSIITDFPVTPFELLAGAAALTCRGGLNEEDALRMVTCNPAKVLGIDGDTGSIEKGKRADLALFRGHPFDLTMSAAATWIAGRKVHSGEIF